MSQNECGLKLELARDIFAEEASFTSSEQAHLLTFMRTSVLDGKSGHSKIDTLYQIKSGLLHLIYIYFALLPFQVRATSPFRIFN